MSLSNEIWVSRYENGILSKPNMAWVSWVWLKSSLRLGQAKVQTTQIVPKFLESWLQLDSSLTQQDLLISTNQTKILANRDYKFNFLVFFFLSHLIQGFVIYKSSIKTTLEHVFQDF